MTLAEMLDCFAALTLIEWDRDTFYVTLQATLVKAPRDLAVFDRLFWLVFHGDFLGLRQENNYKKQGKHPIHRGEGPGTGISDQNHKSSGGGQIGKSKPGAMADLYVWIIQSGAPEEMAAYVDEGIASLGELTEEHLTDQKNSIRLIKVHLEWKTGEWQLERLFAGLPEDEVIRLKQRSVEMEDLLAYHWELALVAKFGDQAMELIASRINLQEMDFYQLSHNQIGEMKRIITRLSHRLATRVSRRYVRAKRGQLDLGRTMRKAMATGGIPVFPKFRRRRATKPELVVLCDLSGSVAVFSEFMLQLVYSMQQKFRYVHSFVFVDTVEEISTYFTLMEIEDALAKIYDKCLYSKTGFSHYGEAIQDFWQYFGDCVTRRSTVLILGDARNNYQKPDLDSWLCLKEKAKRVIWLNPEPADLWNTEDSIMDTFVPACTQILECRNLGQLEEVTRDLF